MLTLLHRKVVVTAGLIIALLMAGLFLSKKRERIAEQHGLKKPSQMSFSKANQFSEDFNAKAADPALATEAESNIVPPLPDHEKAAWAALEEILKTKNDNDPRLDRELSQLSPDFHKALFAKYHGLKPEDRNGRGTLVFLVARELKSSADIEFLQKVYEESPCLNMADCSGQPESDPQDSSPQQTSLNYPQMAGLYQLDAQLSKRPDLLKNPQFRAGIYSLLKTAENFPAPQVHDKAQQIREKYGL